MESEVAILIDVDMVSRFAILFDVFLQRFQKKNPLPTCTYNLYAVRTTTKSKIANFKLSRQK